MGNYMGQVTSVANQGSQVPGTIVNLIQNGTRVADIQVDQQGNFSIPDLEPGVYDFYRSWIQRYRSNSVRSGWPEFADHANQLSTYPQTHRNDAGR